MKWIRKWVTEIAFHSLLQEVELTLNYLEEVSERPEVEKRLNENMKKLEKWSYDCPERMAIIEENEQRIVELKKKRRP